MLSTELLEEIRKRPFHGVKIHLSDGTAYEVHHPELVMVGVGSALIGIPDKNQSIPVWSAYELVNLDQITRIERSAPAATSN